MHENMLFSLRHTPTISEIVQALAEATKGFDDVSKTRKNPYYGSRYADLAELIAATRITLAQHGIVVIQTPIVDVDAHLAGVSTLVAHSSGEWILGTLTLPAEMASREGKMRFDGQSVGSAITYARRYSYQAMLNIAAEDDDDGNAALGNDRYAHQRHATEDNGDAGGYMPPEQDAESRIASVADYSAAVNLGNRIKKSTAFDDEARAALLQKLRLRVLEIAAMEVRTIEPKNALARQRLYEKCTLLDEDMRKQAASCFAAIAETA